MEHARPAGDAVTARANLAPSRLKDRPPEACGLAGRRPRAAGQGGAAAACRRQRSSRSCGCGRAKPSQLPDAVLYPRHENEVLALAANLRAGGCRGGAVRQRHRCHAGRPGIMPPPWPSICQGLDNIVSVDGLSGLARVEAGISAAELARQLALRGLSFGSQGFGTRGRRDRMRSEHRSCSRMCGSRPRRIASVGLPALMPGSLGALGVITGATLRVRAVPARTHHVRCLLSRFRQRPRWPCVRCSAAAWRMSRRICRMPMKPASGSGWTTGSRRPSLWQRLDADLPATSASRRQGRRPDTAPSAAMTPKSSTARKLFAALARKLGALTRDAMPPRRHRALTPSCWIAARRRIISMPAQAGQICPGSMSAVRGALDRDHARAGATSGRAWIDIVQRHRSARHDGASLGFTFAIPRSLNDDVAQALAIRRAGEDAIAAHAPPRSQLSAEVMRGIKQLLDPRGILNPQRPDS